VFTKVADKTDGMKYGQEFTFFISYRTPLVHAMDDIGDWVCVCRTIGEKTRTLWQKRLIHHTKIGKTGY